MTYVQNTTQSTESILNSVHRGQKVIVKTFGGEQKQRLVWDVIGDFVYVATEGCFDALVDGADAPMPIAFHWDDVAVLDE